MIIIGASSIKRIAIVPSDAVFAPKTAVVGAIVGEGILVDTVVGCKVGIAVGKGVGVFVGGIGVEVGGIGVSVGATYAGAVYVFVVVSEEVFAGAVFCCGALHV